jgi:branched-subunit amino acid transport protein
MEIWPIMLFIGLLTFSTRLSFIALLERIQLPAAFLRALRFVPIAVLSAIIAPELALKNNQLFISLSNPRLLAGIAATAVAYRTRSVVWSILAGMAVFWGLKLAFGI